MIRKTAPAMLRVEGVARRAALLCTAFLLTACMTSLADPPAPGAGGDTHPTFSRQTMEHEGRTRHYLVHDFSGDNPAPVVFILHGGGGHAENAVDMSQFDVIAAREKLIAVYPAGTGGTPGGRLLTWNAGHCCAYARENQVDDVGFIARIIDDLVSSGNADAGRIYVTGMSNGGMMAHRLGLELSDRIAAIAPVVGALFGDEVPPATYQPVASLMIIGATDAIVPGAGGPLAGRGDSRRRIARRPEDRDTISARAAADFWAGANGCGVAVQQTTAAADMLSYPDCQDDAEVVLVTVADNGHAWPGGRPGRAEADPPTMAWNASEEMWRFFARHGRR
ncbi:MAG: PHB depolymerase family esterase [Pseudomonadales bacterium]|nr:hypothetical protein [Pseudomonadales bacterium]